METRGLFAGNNLFFLLSGSSYLCLWSISLFDHGQAAARVGIYGRSSSSTTPEPNTKHLPLLCSPSHTSTYLYYLL